MKGQIIYRLNWRTSMALLILFAIVGCQPQAPALPPASASTSVPASTPESASIPTPGSVEPTPTSLPITNTGEGPLYQDDFTNPGSGWDDAKLGDYFVGYHGPEWYHIEIDSPNEKVAISEPNKKSYDDVSLELQVFAVAAKTAATGDYRYGLVFRRSGSQYYAFTISPTTKKWAMLKVSPDGVETLQEGTDDSIKGLDTNDLLRVDVAGSNFSLYINDHNVGQVTDATYASGEVGLYAESIDGSKIHIHFDTFTIQAAPSQVDEALYQDDFTNPGSGWDDAKLGDYFVGYHGPEWYHIEIDSSKEKVAISEPNRKSYDDVTLELQVFAVAAKTAATGDYRYGLVFRRSGEEYYAFTISPTTKKWAMLKVSPAKVETLQEGTDDSIKGLDTNDLLRVDVAGSNFLLYINGHNVGQVTDTAYANGEVGLYAESIDSSKIHVHYDTFSIRALKVELVCTINAGMLYVRSGPGKTYAPITLLTTGNTVEPLGISPDREWIKIKPVQGSKDPGWIFTSEAFVACNAPVDVLPTIPQ